MDTTRVLIIEDDSADAVMLSRRLNKTGIPCEVVIVPVLNASDEHLADCDLVIADLHLPDCDLSDVIDRFSNPGIAPRLVMSGQDSLEINRECGRRGLRFISKSLPEELFVNELANAMELVNLQREVAARVEHGYARCLETC